MTPVPASARAAQEKCFACDRPMKSKYLVACKDEQTVYVGSECFRLIRKAGAEGYQPPKGGPKLYPLVAGDDDQFMGYPL